MKNLVLLNILILVVILFSCQKDSQLSEVQKEEIIDNVKEMASQFFIELDAGRINNAMNYIDSSATFNFIDFFIGTIKRDDISNAYSSGLKRRNSFMSQWIDIEIDPLTNKLAYYQGHFNQVMTDSLGEVHKVNGYISTIVTLRDKNWKFLKGQIYMQELKSP